MIKQNKGTKILQWVRYFNFLLSVIILFIILEVLTLFGIYIRGLSYLLGLYIFIGGLIWFFRTKEMWLRWIRFGSLFAFWGLMLWLPTIGTEFNSVIVGLASCLTFLGALFLFFGIKRYLKWKKGESKRGEAPLQ
jgi:hypothetical protein